jgi:hypothetical protein
VRANTPKINTVKTMDAKTQQRNAEVAALQNKIWEENNKGI